MSRVVFSAVLFSAVVCSLSSRADEVDQGIYLRLDTGSSFSRRAGGDVGNDVGTSAIFGGGIGYRFNQYFRSDMTLSYRNGYKVDSSTVMEGQSYYSRGDVKSLVGLANVYIEPIKIDGVRPYVGGGLGFAHNTINDVTIEVAGLNGTLQGATSTSFAWQAGAGIGIDIVPNLTADIGYHYMDMGESKTGSHVNIAGWTSDNWTSRGNLRAHELQLGLRYQF